MVPSRRRLRCICTSMASGPRRSSIHLRGLSGPESAPRAGFEPAAYSLGGSRSIRLSYRGSDGDDSPLLEAGVVELGGVDQGVDKLLDVRGPLDLAQVVGLAACDRQLRGEQLAAVLVGENRDLVRAELLRDLNDLLLVAVDQRPQERQLCGLLH